MLAHPDVARHVERLKSHVEAAKILRDAGNEWAVVCYFYAAFHALRVALLHDERLNSDAAARGVNENLTASSRHVDFHSGHPSRGPGLNQIANFLYPEIGAKYVLLHVRSVEVRYGQGITAGTIGDVQQITADVVRFFQDAGLVADE